MSMSMFIVTMQMVFFGENVHVVIEKTHYVFNECSINKNTWNLIDKRLYVSKSVFHVNKI